MNLGLVKYLNALPFHIKLNINNLKILFDHPSALNKLLSSKELDVALTSSIASFSNSYEILPFGIACKGPVLSVNLYTKKDLGDGSKIALTHASATSVALLKILCHHVWQITPEYVPAGVYHDAKLLIGDEALLHFSMHSYKRIDLCEEWHKMTGLPFVFAIVMAQKNLDCGLLKNALEYSLTWAEQNRDAVIQRAEALSTVPKERLSHYYNSLYYRLGEEEFRSLELFSRFNV